MNVRDPLRVIQSGNLRVRVYPDRKRAGEEAAAGVSEKLASLLSAQPVVRMVFAAAPSQNEFLAALASSRGIDWRRVTAFHMDEYLGLEEDAGQLFSTYLARKIFGIVPFGKVHIISSRPKDAAAECRRYALLLGEAPIDIVCLGIGENGHIAFNDPHVADFNDPLPVKVVMLDDRSRLQQVHDGCFSRIEDVPREAITLTIPALCSGRSLSVVVPGPTKAEAVYRTLTGTIDATCPATVLRTHGDSTMYIDSDAAAKLQKLQ